MLFNVRSHMNGEKPSVYLILFFHQKVSMVHNKIQALKFNICPKHTENAHTDNEPTSDITVNTINIMN